jgi:hypothetical protein
MYIEAHIVADTYGSEAHFVIKSTSFRNRFERHGRESSVSCILDYALHEDSPYTLSFIRSYEANTHVPFLVPVVLVD